MSETQRRAGPGIKRLNEHALRPGDIILMTTTAKLSAAIRIATRSDVSHAMVYVEDRSLIDATDQGVQAGNTRRLFIDEECPVHALRLKDAISADQLSAVETYLRGHIGARYSKKEAALTMFGGAPIWSRQQFCSRLVAQAFASAGIELVANPNFCSPAELKASPRLVPVAQATVPVPPEELAWWESRDDVPQLMLDAINAVLDGARKRNPGIETFDDLHAHLIAHPEQDEEMCRLLETSGYLSVWRSEQAKNPWQYDLALMDSGPAADIEEYCWAVLANEDGRPNRFVVNRGAYALLARSHRLRFFQIMLELYELLATQHRQRLAVAAQWLESRGLLAASAPVAPLTPHSPEWFAALYQWNPAQASMTRLVLKLMGRADVCSICSDDPASDYRLEEMHRPAGGVDTLRLCDDCVQIRRAGGEPYAAVS